MYTPYLQMPGCAQQDKPDSKPSQECGVWCVIYGGCGVYGV